MSNASDTAYLVIRSAILSGALPAGAQLTEEDLAERCSVSRTPVRDALRRLESELYVRRSESQRVFVSEWTAEELEDAYVLRAMLEAHAASRAAVRADAEAIVRLRANCDQIRVALDKAEPDIEAFLTLNREYHTLLLAAAESARLSAMLSRLILPPIVHRTAMRYSQEQLERSLAEHDEVVAAIAARDTAWAAAVMTAHIRRAYHVYSAHRVPSPA